jgi:sialidase-1
MLTAAIELLEHHVVWENPTPTFTSRHAYFPGMVKCPSGDLLAIFPIGQAFESADQIIYTARSKDNGHTWSEPKPVHEDFRPGLGALKINVLDDGSLIATGYSHYPDGEHWISHITGGCPDGMNLICYSNDDGHTWTLPKELHHRYPEVLEISGPCIQLQNGDLVALGTPIPMYDGSRPTGIPGIAMRSSDRGQTWDDSIVYFDNAPISPLEARLAQLDDGRIVAIAWSLDESSGVCHNNLITISHDNGHTWSPPQDTGLAAQASSVLARPGNNLLSIHAHREKDPVGLFVRVIDLADDKWQVVAEVNIWDRIASRKVTGYADMGANVKFGQPSLLHVDGDEYLAYHWAIEDGQGRILSHRLRIEF